MQHNRLSMVTNLLRPSPLINGTSGRGASLCLKSFEWRWCDVWILLCLRFIHSFIHEHFRFISSAKVSHLFYFLRSQRQSHLYDLMSTPTATLVVCHSIRAAKAFDIYSYVCKCMFRRLSPDFCGAAFEKRYMETGCYVVPRVFWCVQCKSAANSKSNEACSPDPETFCTYLTIFLCFNVGVQVCLSHSPWLVGGQVELASIWGGMTGKITV